MKLRHLHVTSPLIGGPDVESLQAKLRIKVDGHYGPVTAKAVHRRKYLMGFPRKALDSGASAFFQELLLGLRKAPYIYRVRAKARRQRRAERNKGQIARNKATDWFVERAGRTESPAGSNRNSEWLDAWQLECGHAPFRSGEQGWPWCGVGVHAAYLHGAGINLSNGVIGSWFLLENSAAGTNGFRRIASKDARRGDIVLFFAPGGPEHIGMLRAHYEGGGKLLTIEANTSFGPGGSQANGGCIAKRERSITEAICFIRATATD